MKFTPFPIVLLLVDRHNIYRKELRIANNTKITYRSRIQNDKCIHIYIQNAYCIKINYFKKLKKPEMYLITKANSLPTSQKAKCLTITVHSWLNDPRGNDRWVRCESIAGVFFPRK